MGCNGRSYTDEYRLECADYVITSEKPATVVAAELGIPAKTLQGWVRARRSQLAGGLEPQEGGDELRAARKRIRELELENEFLKKRAPSSPETRHCSQVPPDGGGEGVLPGQDDGQAARRVEVGLLRLAGQGRRAGPVVGAARVRQAAVGRVGPHVRGQDAARDAAGGARARTLYRVRKLMRELGIRGVAPNSKKRTTVPDEGAPSRPDLIRRDFTAAVPCTRLVGDITYLKTGQGWLYLATVIDLCTRMVVGWAISERMTADIAVEALERARRRGYVAGNAIFHSDRGAQYTSRLLARWAAEHEVRLSVGRTGSCHDNAVAESFFGTLKNEMYHRRKWKTRLEARNAVIDFIERRYNRSRPHSTIGNRIPAEAMESFYARTAPKPAAPARAAADLAAA